MSVLLSYVDYGLDYGKSFDIIFLKVCENILENKCVLLRR